MFYNENGYGSQYEAFGESSDGRPDVWSREAAGIFMGLLAGEEGPCFEGISAQRSV